MSDPRSDGAGAPGPVESEAAANMLAELGPLAYALLELGEAGPLSEVRTFDQSRAACVPAQAAGAMERDIRSEALLDELGELDI